MKKIGETRESLVYAYQKSQEEMWIVQGQKVLKRGYTTGSTATAAAAHALELLAEQYGDYQIQRLKIMVPVNRQEDKKPDSPEKPQGENKLAEPTEIEREFVRLLTPKGIAPFVQLKDYYISEEKGAQVGYTSAIKESGDDPDVTHGAEIGARVYFGQGPKSSKALPYTYSIDLDNLEIRSVDVKNLDNKNPDNKNINNSNLNLAHMKNSTEDEAGQNSSKKTYGQIHIIGGTGVGTVTKGGLAPTKGHSAINPVPRQMMLKEVQRVLRVSAELRGQLQKAPLWIEISVQNGEQIAQKTFNPKLGIQGGISILGTSGIVEPMSEKALVDTIKTELNQFKTLETGLPLLICPGNYGQAFAKEKLHLDLEKSVKMSNYVGETLDYCIHLGIPKALIVGHAGKLVKIAAAVMNTHSAYGDGRQEVMASHGAIHGASLESIKTMMEAISIEEMLDALMTNGEQIYQSTLKSIGQAIQRHIDHRTKKQVQIEFIVFTNTHGVVIQSDCAHELLNQLQEEQ